jgi:hypothetical protein
MAIPQSPMLTSHHATSPALARGFLLGPLAAATETQIRVGAGRPIRTDARRRSIGDALKVPAAAGKSDYLGNGCLMRLGSFDVGPYLDRSAFAFAVA